jgi:general stress protein 26
MAHEEHHKAPEDYEDRVWELSEKIRFCLFTTWDGERQAQWPLSAMPDREAGVIEFLVGLKAGRYGHLEQFPAITLGFADTAGSKYLVINGHARLSDDRARIKARFSPFAKAWWDSPDDPDIRLLTVTPDQAELWEGPGKLIAGAIMLAAAVTGAKPAVGDHGAVRL